MVDLPTAGNSSVNPYIHLFTQAHPLMGFSYDKSVPCYVGSLALQCSVTLVKSDNVIHIYVLD